MFPHDGGDLSVSCVSPLGGESGSSCLLSCDVALCLFSVLTALSPFTVTTHGHEEDKTLSPGSPPRESSKLGASGGSISCPLGKMEVIITKVLGGYEDYFINEFVTDGKNLEQSMCSIDIRSLTFLLILNIR